MNDPFSLMGKRALVTGGSGNLGSGISHALARAGATVAISYIGSSDRAEQTANELRQYCGGARAAVFQADLRKEEDVQKLLHQVVGQFGGLDILVNNSGVFSQSLQEELSLDSWREIFDLNVQGLFLCSREAIPYLRKAEDGVIINIASINALHPGFGETAHYDASKGAVSAYTKSLAAETAKDGIRVNAVAPGLIDSVDLRATAKDLVEMYEKRAPLGRLVKIEDVGNTVVFLSSDAASAITGEILTVDCGYLLS
ncbi:MAG: SDR family oxidoreductase [Bacteroidetes bacterium]|nr:SDR family oxidoreductase [Bacteroidota bacterium]